MSARLQPDGTRILTASYDGTARLWDAVTGRAIASSGATTACVSGRLQLRRTRIVTASYDRTARIWDAATGEEIAVLRGH